MELFKLFGTIAVKNKDANERIDETTGKAKESQNKISDAFKKIGKAVAIGFSAKKIYDFGKAIVNSYADYEQLAGGVKTLFDDSSNIVMQYAKNAYKTAGLSANEYMETVTSFSASLIQSLGGDTYAAAQKADMAITDMSDNANKMGTSIESLQNAYSGFAKGNFTMLDNLKLGYGGTKEEMQRLLDKAQEISGIEYDISSYSDIVDAIHVVQTEMDITGTTALEANETISGSISAAKSAWQNLLTGVADGNQNLGLLVQNFLASVETAARNLLPRISQIVVKIPGMMLQMLPGILSIGKDFILSLVNGITVQLPTLIDTAADLIIWFVESIVDNIDVVVDTAITLITTLADGLIKALPKLIEKAPEIVAKLVDSLISNAPKLLTAGVELILQIATGIFDNLGEIGVAAGQIIEKLLEGIVVGYVKIVEAGVNLIGSLIDGIKSAWGGLVSFFEGLWDGLFGHRTVNVNANVNTVGGTRGGKKPVGALDGFATGLDYVPYDEFPALLHKGEMVLPASQARVLRDGGSLGNAQNSNAEVVSLLRDIKNALDENMTRSTSVKLNNREIGRVVRGLV